MFPFPLKLVINLLTLKTLNFTVRRIDAHRLLCVDSHEKVYPIFKRKDENTIDLKSRSAKSIYDINGVVTKRFDCIRGRKDMTTLL